MLKQGSGNYFCEEVVSTINNKKHNFFSGYGSFSSLHSSQSKQFYYNVRYWGKIVRGTTHFICVTQNKSTENKETSNEPQRERPATTITTTTTATNKKKSQARIVLTLKITDRSYNNFALTKSARIVIKWNNSTFFLVFIAIRSVINCKYGLNSVSPTNKLTCSKASC